MLHLFQNSLTTYTPSTIPATPSLIGPGPAVATTVENTKGAWTTMMPANELQFDACGITVAHGSTSVSGSLSNWAMDIGLGAAGSERVIVSNLIGGGRTGWSSGGYAPVFLPIFIPKGSRVAVRAQTTLTGARTLRPAMWFHQLIGPPSFPVYHHAETINFNAATGACPAFTPTQTTKGAWENLGAATTRDYGAVVPLLQMDAITDTTNYFSLDLGIGGKALWSDLWFSISALEVITGPCGPTYPCGPIPEGTVFQGRGERSTATAANIQVGMLGMY